MVANWEYSYNGLTFGGATKYGIIEVDGLTEPPDIREDSNISPGRHGGFIFADRYDFRRITITADLVDSATFETSLDALKAAFVAQGSPLPLIFKRPGMSGSGQMRINCKPIKVSLPLDKNFQLGYGAWAAQLVAEDPRIYDDSLSTSTVNPNSTLAGQTNAGNIPTVFENVRFNGPGTTFTFRINGDAVNQLKLLTTLTGGQYIDVNFKDRTLTRDNGSNQYGVLDAANSKWWELPVGSTTLQNIIASGSTGASTMVATWRSAWV